MITPQKDTDFLSQPQSSLPFEAIAEEHHSRVNHHSFRGTSASPPLMANHYGDPARGRAQLTSAIATADPAVSDLLRRLDTYSPECHPQKSFDLYDRSTVGLALEPSIGSSIGVDDSGSGLFLCMSRSSDNGGSLPPSFSTMSTLGYRSGPSRSSSMIAPQWISDISRSRFNSSAQQQQQQFGPMKMGQVNAVNANRDEDFPTIIQPVPVPNHNQALNPYSFPIVSAGHVLVPSIAQTLRPLMTGLPANNASPESHPSSHGNAEDIEDHRETLTGSHPLDNGPATVDSTKYKTSLCRNFQRSGVCPYGSICTFAHGCGELRNPSENATAVQVLNRLAKQITDKIGTKSLYSLGPVRYRKKKDQQQQQQHYADAAPFSDLAHSTTTPDGALGDRTRVLETLMPLTASTSTSNNYGFLNNCNVSYSSDPQNPV